MTFQFFHDHPRLLQLQTSPKVALKPLDHTTSLIFVTSSGVRTGHAEQFLSGRYLKYVGNAKVQPGTPYNIQQACRKAKSLKLPDATLADEEIVDASPSSCKKYNFVYIVKNNMKINCYSIKQ